MSSKRSLPFEFSPLDLSNFLGLVTVFVQKKKIVWVFNRNTKIINKQKSSLKLTSSIDERKKKKISDILLISNYSDPGISTPNIGCRICHWGIRFAWFGHLQWGNSSLLLLFLLLLLLLTVFQHSLSFVCLYFIFICYFASFLENIEDVWWFLFFSKIFLPC